MRLRGGFYLKTIKLLFSAFALFLLLGVATTVSAEKTDKPKVRTVNGMAIVQTSDGRVYSHTSVFKFYAKVKGKWVRKSTETIYQDRDGTFYQNVAKNGTYAVTATVGPYDTESEKTVFKIKNAPTIPHGKNPFVYKQSLGINYAHWGLGAEMRFLGGYPNYKYLTLIKTPIDKYKYRTVIAYYIDSKGKLHKIDKKKLTKRKGKGDIAFIKFPVVKGQEFYAFAMVNSKGKISGYYHAKYSFREGDIVVDAQSFPGVNMKYKASEWK